MERPSKEAAALRAEVVRLRVELQEAEARLRAATAGHQGWQRVLHGPRYHTFCLEPSEDAWRLLGVARSTPLPSFLQTKQAARALDEAAQSRQVVTFTSAVTDGEAQQRGAAAADTMLRVRLEPVLQEGDVRWLVGAAHPALPSTGDGSPHAALSELGGESTEVMDLLPDAVTIVTTSHEVVYVNAACTRLLGAEAPEAVVGRSVWAFIHPDDLPTVLAHLNADDRSRPVQYRIRRLDGEERIVETVMVPILHDGQPAMLSTARDMSHQHHMRRALTNTQDLFHHIFEAVPAALVLVRTDDGVCVDANAAFAELTGRSRNEVIGTRLERCDFWQEPDVVQRSQREAREEAPVAPTYFHLRRPDGDPRVAIGTFEAVDLRGQPHALGVLLDITEGERTRRQLLQISKAVESMSDAVALLDPEGRVTYQNNAFTKLLGFDTATLNKAHGGPSARIADEQTQASVRAAMNEGRSWRGDLELQIADGATVPVALRADSVRDSNDTVIGLVWILSDVSERRAVEQQLITAKERAEEASRIKSAILTNITHEVRTPLTVILGFTSMMRKGINTKYERFVDLIERSGKRLLLTLDSMLDLAQLEAGTLELSPEPVDLVEVAHSVIDTLQPIAQQKGIDLRLRTTQETLPVYQDHRMLVRVLHNLLDNGLKFTSDGHVEVTLRRSDDGATVYLIVEDTGVGIDPSFANRIFDEFSQESSGLERSYQGSGLGLTVSRRLIERVGGRIHVDSNKGEGTTFHVTLPADIRPLVQGHQ